MAIVFDYQAWAFRYPEIAQSVPQGMAQALYAEAGLYLFPGDGSLVTDEGQRLLILNMIVAHIALLRTMTRNGLIGRVTSASEGSVSVSVAAMTVPGSAEWFALTGPGLSAWAALAPFRTARVILGPGGRRAARAAYGAPWFRGF